MTELRKELPPLPARIAALPVDKRGYPVPWFVLWLENGEPEFRIMDGRKIVQAYHERLCWVCGQHLGSFLAFVIGPMCAINRISSEPPSHRECAVFSAKACPFLSRPHMRRRDITDESIQPLSKTGFIERNPGVGLVWVTKTYALMKIDQKQPADTGNVLFEMGEPTEVLAFAEGRLATSDEIRASVEGGYPILLAEAKRQGTERYLERQLRDARRVLRIA
jgi:hypothetical protein